MSIHKALRASLVPLLLSSVFAEGCSCSGGNIVTGEPSIRFTFPADGATVSSNDDVNPTVEGVQVNVQVAIEGMQDGEEVVLTNSRALDGTGLPIPTTGTISGGQVTFGGYTLPLGEVELTVRFANEPDVSSCDQVTCDTVSITVVETVCLFNTPLDGDVVTQDQYPDANDPFDPIEIDVVVDCRGVDSADFVALTVDQGVPLVGVPNAEGRVVFSEVALSEGPNRLTLLPRTDSDGNDPQGPSTAATVTVSTGRCAVRVRPPNGSRLLAEDDLGPAVTGMQTTVDVITDCPNTSVVTLHMGKAVSDPTLVDVTPAAPPQIAADVGGTRFRFTNFVMPESTEPFDVWLVARVVDAGGQFGVSVPNQYWVDSEIPSFLRAEPADNACLPPASDDPSVPGVQLLVSGDTSGVVTGAEVWVRVVDAAAPSCEEDEACEVPGAPTPQVCRKGLCRYVGGIGSNGEYSISGVTVPNGAVRLEYILRDRAGNLSVPVLADIVAFDTLPSVTITDPIDGALLTIADDLSNTAAGVQYNVTLAITGAAAGSFSEVRVPGQQPNRFALPPLPGGDSVQQVLVTLLDGQRTLEAEVRDVCETPYTHEISVTATSSPIAFTATAYEAGTQLSVPVPDGSITVASAVDFDIVTGTSVGDRTLELTFFDEVTTDVPPACTGIETQAAVQEIVPATSAGTVISDVALIAPGINCVNISLTGPGGSIEGAYVIDHRTTTMALAYSDPSGAVVWTDVDDSDGDPTNGFNRNLEVTLTPAADVGGTLQIRIAGTSPVLLGSKPVASGESAITFSGVSLPLGIYELDAVWTDAFGLTSTSPRVDVEVQGDGPAILVTAPAWGASISNASLDVVVAHLGGPEPAVCRLYIDDFTPGNDVASDIWSPGAASLTFSNTIIPDVSEGPHALRVECADGATPTPNVSVFTLGVITIDDTAPQAPAFVDEPEGTPGRVVFVDGAFVNGLTPMTGGGTRHPVMVEVDAGFESLHGFRLELTSSAPGDAPQTQALCLWEGVAGPAQPGCIAQVVVPGLSQNVTFPSVNFGSAAEGTLTLELSLVDTAGNRSPVVDVDLIKDTVPPVITQNSPDPAKNVLSVTDDFSPGTPEVDVRFTYTVTGGVPGADCINDAARCLRLEVTPAPVNHPTGIAPQAIAVNNTVDFGELTFANQPLTSYTAELSTTDAAGNVGTFLYAFDVFAGQPQLEWSNPPLAQGTIPINAEFSSFTAVAAGIQVNTPVVLCTTVLPPSVPPLAPGSCNPSADLGCPCRHGATQAGHVIAVGSLAGSFTLSGATLLIGGIADGVQVMHFEARELDGSPNLTSSFSTLNVDRTPPVVTSFTLDQNNAANDATNIRLGRLEGTPSGNQLVTPVTVNITGAGAGAPVVVRRGFGSPIVQVGQGTLDGSGSATFNITLSQGLNQPLWVYVQDPAGNETDGLPTRTVDVDVTAPTVSVPPAAQLFTSLSGVIDTAGTPQRSDDTIPVTVVVSVGDNNPVGATLSVQLFDAPSGGNPVGAPVSLVLGAGQTSRNVELDLPAGDHWVQATLTDVFSNATTAARQLYQADFYGPVMTLSLRNGAGVAQACGDSAANPCIVDTLAPSNGRTPLDLTGTDPYCPPPPFDGECQSSGSDLRVVLNECANTPSENCASTPIAVRLQSALVGGLYGFVFNGAFAASGDITPDASIAAQPGAAGYAFAAAVTRQIRLQAVDIHGNESFSNVMFIKLNQGGIVPQVQLMDAALAPFNPVVDLGDIDASGDVYLGQAENVSVTAGTFAMNLRVALPLNGIDVPTSVELSCAPNPCRPGEPTITESNIQGSAPNLFVQILGVQLPLSSPLAPVPNTLDFAVYCGASLCGERDYSQVHADIEPPTYQFDRCSLCNLGVPYAGAAADCSTCAADNASATADISGEAVWNSDGDQNTGSSTTFSIAAAQPLVLRVRGLDNNQSVTITSNQGALAGGTRNAVTGCGSTASPCSVSFTSLEVPSLASNASRHVLTASFTDKAGNAAVPESDRCSGSCDPMDEAITAMVDTVRPEGVPTTACIGESTLPFTGSVAHAVEDPQCATYCGMTGDCDRRAGAVTLRFTAPRDDGASGGNTPVVSYEVLVAALSGASGSGGFAIPYGPSNTVHTSCDTVVHGADVEQVISLSETPGTPGSEHVVSITGLRPHRDYCFAVLGVDDAGNRADVGTAHANRVLPLLTDIPAAGTPPEITPFASFAPVDNPTEGAFKVSAAGEGYGWQMRNIGDMDNDGVEDFVIAGAGGALDVFLSNGPNLGTPRPLATPIRLSVTGNAYFSWGAAGGDFNADGISDLAICDAGAFGFSGAVHMYYGRNDVGIDATRVNGGDPDLPNILPDVTLRAPCNKILLADIDGVLSGGNPSDDLILLPFTGADFKRVIGFKGGGNQRFPSALITLNTTDGIPSGWNPATPSVAPTNPARPDFTLRARNSPGGASFPIAATALNLDADPGLELVVSDNATNHGSGQFQGAGEAYVYKGGTALTGDIAAPDTLPTQLLNILRYQAVSASTNGFGLNLARIPRPVSTDSADWLFVKTGNRRGIIFKAQAAVGIVPRDPDVTNPRVYPAGGLDGTGNPIDFWELDTGLWDGGGGAVRFGGEMEALGEWDGQPGVDIAVAPADGTDRYVFIYSFSEADHLAGNLGFSRRAILRGADGRFGHSLAVIRDYFGEGTQLAVTTYSFASPDGMVHLYR